MCTINFFSWGHIYSKDLVYITFFNSRGKGAKNKNHKENKHVQIKNGLTCPSLNTNPLIFCALYMQPKNDKKKGGTLKTWTL